MNLTAEIITSIVSCLISSVMGGMITYFVTRLKRSFKREKAIEEGVRSLLRNNLIECHDKYTARGHCPIYVKESARRSYEAYHALGGNGVVTKLYSDIMALPESEREQNREFVTKE